ncbi:MAG: LysM peptidoglycan-binding domain-containing protein [Phycisphaerales bacterium]|nr:LysM peptidoglycan-binding domain-containing protein [Phycisphaerales bacterium]
MDERSSRIFFGLCMLVLVWIGVYWMWQPNREQSPIITFEQPPVEMNDSDSPDSDPESNEPESIVDSPQIDNNTNNPAEEETSDQPRVIAPEFIEHIVAPNEVLQTIAKHYFGSIDDWPVIAKANPRVDPQKLKAGMILRIPKDKNNIQGVLENNETVAGVIESHTNPESKVIEYVVRSGDSLSLISKRIYGSTRYAGFIYESNRDTLRSIDSISVGQLLRLPPIPEDD